MTVTMTGHGREFEVPARLRDAGLPDKLTAWDLLHLDPASPAPVLAWAGRVVESLVATATRGPAAALDCDGCDDTGWYGVTDPTDPDTLTALLRRHGDGHLQLTASGVWAPATLARGTALEVLDDGVAQDLAAAVMASSTLTRRYFMPAAFLPPEDLRVPAPHPAALLAAPVAPAAPRDQSPTDDGHDWLSYAIVDPLDTGAVLQVIRLRPGPVMERYESGGVWVPDPPVLSSLTGIQPPPLVELDPTLLTEVLRQVDSGTVDGEDPTATTAAARGSSAEVLRRFWSTGKGGAKIRWNTPGDWTRCYKYLSKHMGTRAKGYCQKRHREMTGTYAGSKGNRASAAPMMKSPEESLLAALAAGAWVGTSTTMTTTAELRDAVYEAVTDLSGPVVRSLVAGAFPDVPPAEWFDDPKLTEVTATVVEPSGRVYGHLADWQTSHIGLPNDVKAPRSRSNYRYFNRGALPVAASSGERATVTVGQLTLVGGHAPIEADARGAVAHYDDTNSAIADVHVGEDQFGIWFAGALRSSVTPDRLRVFCASSLSGDWRPINGGLELVACCSVNSPGFPIARARVAGGAIMALVAAGALGVAEKGLQARADRSVVMRLERVEAELVALRAATDPVVEDSDDLLAGVDVVEVPAAGSVVPAPDGVEVVLAQDGQEETVIPLDEVAEDAPADELVEDEEVPGDPVPPAVLRARLRSRARLSARVRRTSEAEELAKLVAAAETPMVAAFKLEDWMTPTGADGAIVRTGSRITVSSKSDESVAVARVVNVTRRGIQVRWTAGRTGTSTISSADVASLVRTSAQQDAGKTDGGAEGKAEAPADGVDSEAEPVAASARPAVPASVARARALLAGFNPNQLRDNRGRFIEMGATVNVKGDDGKERRGTVTKLTKGGPQITYDDGGSGGPGVEIVPSAETTDRIEVAPKAKADLGGGGDNDELPQGVGGLTDDELMELRDAADDAGNVKQKAALQKLMDTRHDDALAGPGVPTPPKPDGVTDEQWRLSLLDRKYARDNGLPEPTAKQAREFKADYDAAVADLAKQNARRTRR